MINVINAGLMHDSHAVGLLFSGLISRPDFATDFFKTFRIFVHFGPPLGRPFGGPCPFRLGQVQTKVLQFSFLIYSSFIPHLFPIYSAFIQPLFSLYSAIIQWVFRIFWLFFMDSCEIVLYILRLGPIGESNRESNKLFLSMLCEI